MQGVTWVLGADGLRARRVRRPRRRRTCPLGSGLSSSAALEVALLRALRERVRRSTLDDVPLARLAQRAENDFVGAPVGIMDQMACSLAGDAPGAVPRHAHARRTSWCRCRAGVELVVINSGVAHNHAKGDYRTRRAECEQAAAALGVPQLRDLDAGRPRRA